MLAEHLKMTVYQLLTNMSSYEVTEWKMYLKIKSEQEEKRRKRAELAARVKNRVIRR